MARIAFHRCTLIAIALESSRRIWPSNGRIANARRTVVNRTTWLRGGEFQNISMEVEQLKAPSPIDVKYLPSPIPRCSFFRSKRISRSNTLPGGGGVGVWLIERPAGKSCRRRKSENEAEDALGTNRFSSSILNCSCTPGLSSNLPLNADNGHANSRTNFHRRAHCASPLRSASYRRPCHAV